MAGQSNVVVVGGGYAGTMAASRLSRRQDLTVRLVNPRPYFVNRIRLHQRVAGNDTAVIDFQDVLNDRVELVTDAATQVDPDRHNVDLAGGARLTYDYLVYAVGSAGGNPTVPGVEEYGYSVATLEEAQRLRDALEQAPFDIPITVVGAGPTGIETAAELAEKGHEVTLVCGGELGPSLHPRGRRAVARQLERLAVTVVDGLGSVAKSVTADAVELSNGRTVPSGMTIWTAGFSVPDLAARSGLSVDPAGRLVTDETLTSIDDTHIIATGDAAAPSNLPYRMSCQAAVQLGPQAADTVISRIDGRQPANVRAGFGGLCISLGRRTGIFQFTRMNDTALGLHIGGVGGGRVKELICRGIVNQYVKGEARRPGRKLWLGKDRGRESHLHGAAHATTRQVHRAGR